MLRKSILITTIMLIINTTTALAADWVWIYSDDYCTICVDNDSIRRIPSQYGYVFRAFIKWTYSYAGVQQEIEQYAVNDSPLPKDIKNLSYEIKLNYFKYENDLKHIGYMKNVSYNYKGEIISEMGYSYDTPQWRMIVPDSIGEIIFDNVKSRVWQ